MESENMGLQPTQAEAKNKIIQLIINQYYLLKGNEIYYQDYQLLGALENIKKDERDLQLLRGWVEKNL